VASEECSIIKDEVKDFEKVLKEKFTI